MALDFSFDATNASLRHGKGLDMTKWILLANMCLPDFFLSIMLVIIKKWEE